MQNLYQDLIVDAKTLLIVPVDHDEPLSEVIEQFNSKNQHNISKVLIDLLIYVGNRSTRFMEFPVVNGTIKLQTAKKYNPTIDILNSSYDIFSQMPEMVVSQIISPSIRNEIYQRKNQNKLVYK